MLMENFRKLVEFLVNYINFSFLKFFFTPLELLFALILNYLMFKMTQNNVVLMSKMVSFWN